MPLDSGDVLCSQFPIHNVLLKRRGPAPALACAVDISSAAIVCGFCLEPGRAQIDLAGERYSRPRKPSATMEEPTRGRRLPWGGVVVSPRLPNSRLVVSIIAPGLFCSPSLDSPTFCFCLFDPSVTTILFSPQRAIDRYPWRLVSLCIRQARCRLGACGCKQHVMLKLAPGQNQTVQQKRRNVPRCTKLAS